MGSTQRSRIFIIERSWRAIKNKIYFTRCSHCVQNRAVLQINNCKEKNERKVGNIFRERNNLTTNIDTLTSSTSTRTSSMNHVPRDKHAYMKYALRILRANRVYFW